MPQQNPNKKLRRKISQKLKLVDHYRHAARIKQKIYSAGLQELKGKAMQIQITTKEVNIASEQSAFIQKECIQTITRELPQATQMHLSIAKTHNKGKNSKEDKFNISATLQTALKAHPTIHIDTSAEGLMPAVSDMLHKTVLNIRKHKQKTNTHKITEDNIKTNTLDSDEDDIDESPDDMDRADWVDDF